MPVYNEKDNIEDTLRALFNSSEQPSEVIVVDGGSNDGTQEIKLMNNPRRTAASGRNVGIKNTKADIIAFTDGDCIVDKDWIKNIRLSFENNEIDGVGGKVLNAQPINQYEEYWGKLAWTLIMNFPDSPYMVREQKLNDAFVTANCAYKRKVLVQIKGFNNWFANNAEDVDLCWRALKAGAKLMYKMLGKNIVGVLKREKDAGLNVVELTSHLAGKYYGSVKSHVINI